MADQSAPKTLKEHKEKLAEAQAEADKAKRQAAAARRELAKERAMALAEVPQEQLRGFINFIREKGVVGLAVGLAIGTAATGLTTQIVNAVITPTVSLLLGDKGLDKLNWVVRTDAEGLPIVTYAFGDLLDAVLKFLAIAAVIYFVVMGLKLDKLDKKKE